MGRARRGRPSAGFTYLMLLWWIAISGVMLMALARTWSLDARREREFELVFRGDQIKQAIEAYARVPVAEGGSRLPLQLTDLLTDRRSGQVVRHLRRIWPDPITGEEWGFVQTEGGGIQGVYSRSDGMPLRAPNGVTRYSEWRFEADLAAPAPLTPPEQGQGLSPTAREPIPRQGRRG